MSDQNNTDDLIQNLANRASDAPVEEDDSPAEDIDAFLADLESGGDAPDSAPPSAAPSEPDPFADAFAELGDMGELDDDPELAAKLAALAPPSAPAKPKPAPPKPAPEPEPLPPTPEDTAPARAPEPEPEEVSEAPGNKKKDRKKKDRKKDLVKVVETQRSPGFVITMGVLKWSAIMTPVILAIWVVGAFLSSWLETGWLVLALAALPMLIVPLIPKIGLKRGRWWHWAVPLSLLGLVGLIAPWPATAGQNLSHYGHWPSSAIAQAADFQADSAFVRSHAFVAELIGEQIIAIAPPEKPLTDRELLARALGTETELVTWATARREEAKKTADTADKKDAPREDADRKEEVKEPEATPDKEAAEVKPEEEAKQEP